MHSMGYTVLRFQNQSVIDYPEEFLSQIAAALATPTSSARSGHPLPLGEGRDEGNTPSPNGIGVFWQTQGSGKSFSMVFFAQKVLRKLAGNWTFVVVTDRVGLDDQIATTFKACGAVSEAEGDECHAESGAHLRELLRGNHRYVFTLIEEAELDPEQEAKLERELGRQYHILTRDDRLDTVAKDIVRHFLGRGFIGKAMVVSIDKATALKMHDKVRKYWAIERKQVEKEIAELSKYPGGRRLQAAPTEDAPRLEKLRELRSRLDVLETTDMAVVVSPAQNEIPQMKKLGLDIEPHRKRMNDEELDEKFKDSDDPLRLVFVCAMWLTGFDAPSCSTIYLDKPMRNHTLMQTIARANRVFPGKHCGMIVDYANVFASLEKALAIYGAGKGGQNPVKDKAKLVEDLRRSVEAATVFCMSRGVELAEIEAMPTGLDRLTAVSAAVNALISPDPLRREFFGHERLVTTLYQAVK